MCWSWGDALWAMTSAGGGEGDLEDKEDPPTPSASLGICDWAQLVSLVERTAAPWRMSWPCLLHSRLNQGA